MASEPLNRTTALEVRIAALILPSSCWQGRPVRPHMHTSQSGSGSPDAALSPLLPLLRCAPAAEAPRLLPLPLPLRGDVGRPPPDLGGVMTPRWRSTSYPASTSLLYVALPIWIVRPLPSFRIRPLRQPP